MTSTDPTPPTGPAVYRCIANVSRELAKVGIAKERKNDQQGYKFRGIDEVLNALAPVLAAQGLVILPRITSRTLTERVTQKGGILFSVTVCAEFDFVAAEDGSKHTVTMYGEAMDSGDKATNKAMSAAYKYAAFQAFCIPLEGMAADADTVTPDEVQAVAPEGYEAWLAIIEAKPAEGTTELYAAWKQSPEPFRDYFTATYPGGTEALKVKARLADVKAKKQPAAGPKAVAS
jgi:hypothetical protein